MDSEKKPMDPERLDKLRATVELAYRDWVRRNGEELITVPAIPTSMVADLLAAHDYHEQSADAHSAVVGHLGADIQAVAGLDGSERLAADVSALRAEVARLRALAPIDAVQIARSGVTAIHADAWLDASPDWTRIDDGTHKPGPIWRRSDFPIICPGLNLLGSIGVIARGDNARAWALLDEMAAMEVGP